MFKELKGIVKSMYQQRDNISKEVLIIKKSQTEILEIKYTISKIKKFTTGCEQTSKQAEERISELEERSNEI